LAIIFFKRYLHKEGRFLDLNFINEIESDAEEVGVDKDEAVAFMKIIIRELLVEFFCKGIITDSSQKVITE